MCLLPSFQCQNNLLLYLQVEGKAYLIKLSQEQRVQLQRQQNSNLQNYCILHNQAEEEINHELDLYFYKRCTKSQNPFLDVHFSALFWLSCVYEEYGKQDSEINFSSMVDRKWSHRWLIAHRLINDHLDCSAFPWLRKEYRRLGSCWPWRLWIQEHARQGDKCRWLCITGVQ